MVEGIKKVLITGSQGMLGRAIVTVFSDKQKVVGLDIRDSNINCDITDKEALLKAVKAENPGFIIHTAAVTDVDACEQEKERAYAVNCQGTQNIALASREIGAVLCYVSTDYVFNGEKSAPYTEADLPEPLNIYGQTKLAGEDFIKSNVDKYFIVRTSWLYGPGGKNFVDTILNKAKTNHALRVVDDQIGAPTYTLDLARALQALWEVAAKEATNSKKVFGIYHITNSGYCSWYDFSLTIIKCAGLADVRVEAIKTSDLKRPAQRPKMSRLDNTKYNLLTNKPLRCWEEALRDYLRK